MTSVPRVLIVGTFDGVHRGHQALLRHARKRADALGGRVSAAAFVRPPRVFFHPETEPYLITGPREREILLRRYGADDVWLLNFDASWASLSADRFLRDVVSKKWKTKEWVVGPRLGFGRHREGTLEFLRAHAPGLGIRVHSVPPARANKIPVSSGGIRRLLQGNLLEPAAAALGHPPLLVAPVGRGRGLGRRLGYPTANLIVDPDRLLPRGVFATRVTLPSGTPRGGLLNIGTRPTVSRQNRLSVEVHVLDFIGSLNGQILSVEILQRIRPEKKFPSREALVRQIRRDEKWARPLWQRASAWPFLPTPLP